MMMDAARCGVEVAVKIPKILTQGLKVVGFSKAASKLEGVFGIGKSSTEVESDIGFVGKTSEELEEVANTSKVGEAKNIDNAIPESVAETWEITNGANTISKASDDIAEVTGKASGIENEVSPVVKVADETKAVNESAKGETKPTGTGTVWDYIKATPSKDGLHSTYYENYVIPRSFEITVDGQKMLVHGNGTKHINDEVMKQMEFTRDPNLKKFSNPTDYINRISDENLPTIYKDSSLHIAITDPDYYSQWLLTDFKGALEKEISTNGIVYDKLRKSGNWEFKFAKPRAEGQLPVIKHAQFNGWGK